MSLTLLQQLLAISDKVDSPERLALFQQFGAQHYADANLLNLLKNGLVSLLQNGVPDYVGWQVIDFSTTNGGTVHGWLNSRLDPVALQSQALGMVLFQGTIGTRKVIYQFIGAAGTYGATATLATADDFILVYSDVQADIKVFRLAEGQSAATNIIKKFNLNTGWATFGAELPVVIDGLHAPVYLRVRESISGAVNIYNYLWKGAAGSWGHGGTDMEASMLELISIKAESVQDIESDPNTVTVNLGELTSENWLTPLNSAARDFSNTANVFYVVYILESVTYTRRFTGTPGVYGGSGNPAFTLSMFASGPSSETPPYVVATLHQVTQAGAISEKPITVQLVNPLTGAPIGKTVYSGNGFSYQPEGGNWTNVAVEEGTEDGLTRTFPSTGDNEDVAYLSSLKIKSTSKTVATYAAMIAAGYTADTDTFYRVLNDENKGIQNSLYKWDADGTRFWIPAVLD